MDRTQGHFRDAESLSPEAQQRQQFEAVRALVDKAYATSDEFKARMDGAGLQPADIKGMEDFSSIPPLRKKDLISGQQSKGLDWFLSLTAGELRRIYQSPGPIYDPEGRTPDYWGWAVLQAVRSRIRNRNFNAFMRDRHIVHKAPYPPALYEAILDKLTNDKRAQVVPFTNNGKTPGVRNVYLRHDIDTLQCLVNLPHFLEVELRHGVTSGIYFRADDEEYVLSEHAELVRRAKELGFEVGLHTVCYKEEDYWMEFQRETAYFMESTGIRPSSYSIHGLGSQFAHRRREFSEQADVALKKYGYGFTDCNAAFRTYHYLIEDCRLQENVPGLFMYNDFMSPPHFMHTDHSWLILTHPCHWKIPPRSQHDA